MKLPRDTSAEELIKFLSKVDYQVSRQRGSQIGLTRISDTGNHSITIPNHNPIKIGTLASILNDISTNLGIPREKILG